MARRDGYPTNQEMLVDFTTTSHEVFISLYEAHMQDCLPPAFDGKPLKNLSTHIIKRYFEDERPPNSVSYEELYISPIDTSDVDFMDTAQSETHQYMQDTIEYYKAIATQLGAIALTDSLHVRSYIPPAGIISDYTAHFPDGSTRHFNTLRERPAKPPKITIAAGRYFVQEALHYATSGQSHLHPLERLGQALEGKQEGVINHHFTIIMDADLPLNGFESTEFLIAFRDKMLEYLHKQEKHTDKMASLGATQEYLDLAQHQAYKLMIAAENAQIILDGR